MRRQKRRGLIMGMLALVLAATTGFVFASQLQALERQIGARQEVVVLKADVPARSLITADMLEVQQIPRMYAHPAYVQSIPEVAGQQVAAMPLQQGAILRRQDVAPTSGLNDGSRAVSIGVNPISVQVDRITTGSRVDVIVSYEITLLDREGREVETRRTIILLQDVEVLAVAGAPQLRVASSTASGEEQPQESGGAFSGIFGGGASAVTDPLDSLGPAAEVRNTVVVVTLKVTPPDAQKLAYADTFASDIRLALRRADDRAIEPFPPVSEEDFR